MLSTLNIPKKILAKFGKKITLSFLSISLILASHIAVAEVYKVVDKNTSQVTFTDAPQSYLSNSATFELTGINSRKQNTVSNNDISKSNTYARVNAQTSPVASKRNQIPTPNNIESQSPKYSLNIVTPTQPRAYHSPAQAIVVKASIFPRLTNDDKVVWLIDDHEITEGLQASIPTEEIFAGEHSLQVQVVNKKGVALVSDKKTFFIIQRNNAVRARKARMAAVAKYNALPWYKKMTLSMKGQKPKIVK